MRYYLGCIFIIFTFLLAPASNADQHEVEKSPSQSSEADNKQIEDKTVRQPATEAREAFVPTESISEDLSVPFPVDI